MLLKEIIDFKNGKKKPSSEGSIPIYGGNGVLGYTDQNNQDGESLIIGRVGAYCGCVYSHYGKCWISDNAIVGKVKEGNDFYYCYYLLKRLNLNSRHVGSGQPLMTQEILNNIEINICDYETQRKIGKILKNIDDKINLNNEINNNLHELAQLELENDLEENTTKYVMEDLFYQITPGTNYQPARVEFGIPFLNVKNINNGYIDFKDSKYITEADYTKVHKTWQPEENDLLISRIGTLGLVAVIRKEDLPLAVHYNFLDLKTNLIPFEFGYFLLKSNYFQTKYKFNIKNSVQEYVTVDDIRKIEVDIPSSDMMEKYKAYYNKILNIQRENRCLEQLRDTLLPKLMNGELDLDNIDI